jgi:hypothetical protein
VKGETHLAFLEAGDAKPGLARFGLRQENITVKRKQTGAASFSVVPAPASRRQLL